MEEWGVAAVESWLNSRRPETAVRGRLGIGTVVDGWRVSAFLGAGLSAEVYRVTNARLGGEGALKLLTDGSRGLKARFLAEADAIRFLSLDALPRFLGSGEWGGTPYYVMEYLQPLPDPMPRRDVPRFMFRVAKAVHALHEAGFVHRDLKPGNVLRRKNGEPVLIDLGLIKRRGTGVHDPVVRFGRTISIIDGKPVGVGTLDYAAPEQLLKGEASVQSDVFALGKMLKSFFGDSVPLNLKKTVRRATREQPSDRFASAKAFASSIKHRNRPLFLLGFVAALAVAAVAAFPHVKAPLSKFVNRHVVNRHVKDPVTEKESLAKKGGESDMAYFARIVPIAERGDVEAQISVAEAYFYGRGTATNREEAVRWYARAAESGEPAAQASLGLCALRGYGCETDPQRAVELFSLAAEQGHLSAMTDLAYCLLHGIGVECDEEEGFRWAMTAAERGHPPAQTMVGECYLDGRGVDPDVARGETWLYRAARQNNKRAQNLLRTR